MPAISNPASLAGGKYIYAIILDAQDRAFEVLGIDRQPVYSVSDGKVAAVMSDFSRDRIRPERAHLGAHKEVLARLMVDSTVLPMAFGMIANNLKAVRKMLTLNEADFVEQLERVAGKVEMGLRVVWRVPNIFEYFIDHHPDLRATRDRLLGGYREVRQEDKLELGRFFEQLLTEDRETHFNTVEEVLATCCDAIKRLPLRQVAEVMNLSLLVERDRQKELDDAILTAARLFDDNYSFDVNGPWAPHNFVEMKLELGNIGRAEHHAAN